MAANPYTKYLNRLRDRIKQNPYYANARRSAFASTPDKFGNDQFKNAPVGFQAQHNLDKDRIRNEVTTGVVERAGVADIDRKTRISEKIDEIKFKSDEYNRQKKDKLGDQILQVGGAAIGGAIGLAVGAPLQGAAIGASAGQLLGGFTGDNSEDIGAGLASGIQTFTQISSDKKLVELGEIGGEAGKIFSGLDEAGRTDFLFQWQNARTLEQKKAVLNLYLGRTSGEGIALPNQDLMYTG